MSNTRSNLRTRFVSTIGIMLAGFFILLALGTGILESIRVTKEVDDELRDDLRVRLSQTNLRLAYLLESVDAFASSSLVINSLVDATGRASYLPSAMRDFARLREVRSAVAFDFSGKPIDFTDATLPDWFRVDSVHSTLATGRRMMRLEGHLKAVLVVAPIRYYDTPQGGVAVLIDLDNLLNATLQPSEYGYRIGSADGWNTAIGSLADDSTQAQIDEHEFEHLSALGLHFEAVAPSAIAWRALTTRVTELTIVGLIGLLLTVFIASRVGARLAQPIVDLTSRVRRQIHPCGPVGTGDELETLAEAFDQQTEHLRQANDELEHRVAERTHQLELQTRALSERSDELEIAYRDLQQVDRMKDEFVSIVSHELRTPLTSIRGALGLLANDVTAGDPDKTRELTRMALNNGERLARLIDDLLDAQKLASKRFELVPELMEVGAFLDEVARESAGYAHRYNVQVRHVTRPDTLWIKADHKRLRQVLDNLVSNAIKYSPAEGTVELSAEARELGVRIQVRDHGSGVPAEFHDRLFEKFTQADGSTTRVREGTGLGLHITKGIVEAHDGSIGFCNQPDGGALFWVELALADHSSLQNKA